MEGNGLALHEETNPSHRLRVEHDPYTLLIHLSDDDGSGRTTFAVDRATRQWAVAQGHRQTDTARDAFEQLYAQMTAGIPLRLASFEFGARMPASISSPASRSDKQPPPAERRGGDNFWGQVRGVSGCLRAPRGGARLGRNSVHLHGKESDLGDADTLRW